MKIMTCVESVRLSAGIRVGDRFSKATAFTSDSIREFATLVGDTNPLHHDDNAAAEFGGVIASGIHTFSAVFAAVLDFLPKENRNIGLEASVKMLRPVRAGDAVRIEWEVDDILDTPKLRGWIITMNGRLVRQDDVVAMTAISKSLIYW